jgi:hypothetical protein
MSDRHAAILSLFDSRQAPHGAIEDPKRKNPAQGRVFVDSCEERATAYPAGLQGSGRRAREVMPAAMRALVTICGWTAIWNIGSRKWEGTSVEP